MQIDDATLERAFKALDANHKDDAWRQKSFGSAVFLVLCLKMFSYIIL